MVDLSPTLHNIPGYMYFSGTRMIASVPVKQHWKISVKEPLQSTNEYSHIKTEIT